jgi:hypothetical protein
MSTSPEELEKQFEWILGQYNVYWNPLVERLRKATKLSKTEVLLFLNVFVMNGLSRTVYEANSANSEIRDKTLKMLNDADPDEPWKKKDDEEENDDTDR